MRGQEEGSRDYAAFVASQKLKFEMKMNYLKSEKIKSKACEIFESVSESITKMLHVKRGNVLSEKQIKLDRRY